MTFQPVSDHVRGVTTSGADPGLLTPDEQEAVTLAGRLANLISRIVAAGPTRNDDINEAVVHIHGIQHAVMAQAAARAYPDRYRLLGGLVGEKSGL